MSKAVAVNTQTSRTTTSAVQPRAFGGAGSRTQGPVGMFWALGGAPPAGLGTVQAAAQMETVLPSGVTEVQVACH